MDKGASGDKRDEGCFSQSELARWKRRYAKVESMRKGIDKQMLDYNGKINDNFNQSKFSDFLAKMCCLKDDPDAMKAHYNKLYRWTWQFERDMNTDNEASTVKEFMKAYEDNNEDAESALGEGWKWMLQIKSDQKWWNWVYVKASEREGGGLGVFSARDFPLGSVVGYYVGEVIFQDKTEGGKKPSNDDLMTAEVAEATHSVAVRTRKGLWQVLAPKVVAATVEGRFPLFMGLHYMQSACQSIPKNTKEFEVAKRKQNCFLSPDGSIQCIHKIGKNTEMLIDYKTEERASKGDVDDEFNYDLELTEDDEEEDGAQSKVAVAVGKNAEAMKQTNIRSWKEADDNVGDSGKENASSDVDDRKSKKKRKFLKTKRKKGYEDDDEEEGDDEQSEVAASVGKKAKATKEIKSRKSKQPNDEMAEENATSDVDDVKEKKRESFGR